MSRSRLLTWALPALVLGLYLAQTTSFRHYLNDDAYITFRYSRAVAMGQGPYFNPGEHVEGYSNLLWMLLHVPVYALGGENAVPAAAKILGALSGAGCLLLLLGWPRAGKTGVPSGLLAAGLTAASAAFALNTMSGLETTFYAFLITLGVFLGLKGAREERWRGAGLVFAAAALTRPEGIAIFVIYGVAQKISLWFASGRKISGLWRARGFRHLLLDAAVVVVVVGAQLVWRHATYDGEFFPNTYRAKAGGFWAAPISYILDGATPPFLGLFGLTAGLVGWFLIPGTRVTALPVFTVAVGGALLPLVMGADWMIGSRLVVPYLPLLALVVASGWVRLATGAFRRLSRPLPSHALLLLIPLALWWQAERYQAYREETLLRARGYETGHRALAEWLRGGAAKPGDTVALMDIGLVGYLCMEERILDVSGLTDRTIAKSPGPFLDKVYDPAYVLEQEPEFIVLVLTSDADPDRPIPGGTGVACWTKIEARISQDPEFTRAYVHARPPAGPAWTDRLAAVLGAERVFEHRHPGKHYLLAAYRRG